MKSKRLQDSYSAVASRIRDLELESSSPGTIHLSSPAMVPLTPGKNRTWLYAIAALLFSIGAGIVDIAAGRCHRSLRLDLVRRGARHRLSTDRRAARSR